jgi:hypothetical protein
MVNVVSLMGGELKKEQTISGHMADIFSNIYLANALIWNFDHYKLDTTARDICLKHLHQESLDAIDAVRQHLPFHLRMLLTGHINTAAIRRSQFVSKQEQEYLAHLIWKDEKIKHYIEEQIYIEQNGVLDLIKKANEGDDSLVDQIVQVGEFQIPSQSDTKSNE